MQEHVNHENKYSMQILGYSGLNHGPCCEAPMVTSLPPNIRRFKDIISDFCPKVPTALYIIVS